MSRPAFTITSAHVAAQRKSLAGWSTEHVRTIREARQAREAMGTLQPRDVLKRVYAGDGFHQVENDEQLRARLAATPLSPAWRYEPETDTIRSEPQNYCVASLACADGSTDKIRHGEAIARVPAMIAALKDALRFVSGFEGDELQEGIDGPDGLIIRLRAALGTEGL